MTRPAVAPLARTLPLFLLIAALPFCDFLQTGIVAFNAAPVMGEIGASPEEFSGIATLYGVVAIGTILAGAVGVGNIMLIVKERTREIGLRKALGATPASVVAMIMQESLFITAIAGYGGLVVGALSIESVARILNNSGGGAAGMFSRPEVDFKTAMLALFVLILSGLLASLLPAAKAAAVNPVLALQDE